MDSGIYIIRNIIDSKGYVGSTSSFTKRQKTHFVALKNNKHFNIQLQRAVNKYGIEQFIFEIIECVDADDNLLILRENFHIQRLDSITNGYNLTEATIGGGDKISKHPDNAGIRQRASDRALLEYKLGIRKPTQLYGSANGMYGKKRPKEIIDKMTVGRIEYFKLYGHPLQGVPVSEERKQAISNANKGHTRWLGKHHSEETKQKLSNIKKELCEEKRKANGGVIVGPIITRDHIIKNKLARGLPLVIVNDIEYVSCREASELTGEHVCRHRLTSPNIKFAHMYWANNKKLVKCDELGNSVVVFEHNL